MHNITDKFIGALHHLEEQGNVEAIAALFADSSELSSPLKHHEKGKDAAVSFWRTYRGSFGSIRSAFLNVLEQEGVAFLEWVSEGTIGEQPIRYGGVTVIEHKHGQITALRSYFDPAHVTASSGQVTTRQAPVEQEAQARLVQDRMEGGYQ